MQDAQTTIYFARTDGGPAITALHFFSDGRILQDGPDELVQPALEKLKAALGGSPVLAGQDHEPHDTATAL